MPETITDGNHEAPIPCPGCGRVTTLITPQTAYRVYKERIPYRVNKTSLAKTKSRYAPDTDFRRVVEYLPDNRTACVGCLTVYANPHLE